MMFIAVVLFACLPYLSESFPTKCLGNTFFDPVKERFLPCSDCNEKNKDICYECCPKPLQDSDAMYVSEPVTTKPVPSVIYKNDSTNRHIVGVFFHVFIIAMVVCTLSVIICVGFKVAKERHREDCSRQHSHNHDVAIIQEVYAIPHPGSMHSPPKSLPTGTIPTDSHAPQSISKQNGFDKAML